MSEKVAEAAQSGAITNLRLPGLQLLESANWLVTKLHAGLNKLGDLLKQVQREQKSSERDISSVRATLRSLQSVRI